MVTHHVADHLAVRNRNHAECRKRIRDVAGIHADVVRDVCDATKHPKRPDSKGRHGEEVKYRLGDDVERPPSGFDDPTGQPLRFDDYGGRIVSYDDLDYDILDACMYVLKAARDAFKDELAHSEINNLHYSTPGLL